MAEEVGARQIREITTLRDGEASLSLPTPLSPESVDDVAAWLTLVVEKLRRVSGGPPARTRQSSERGLVRRLALELSSKQAEFTTKDLVSMLLAHRHRQPNRPETYANRTLTNMMRAGELRRLRSGVYAAALNGSGDKEPTP